MQRSKKINVSEQSFRYRDVADTWKRRIAKAEESVTIFAPFFDGLLRKLLTEHLFVACSDITIVTTIDPASILEEPRKLHTIKWLLKKGYTVLSLDRLHAKILLIDDRFVTVGSQNFTLYARRSKEATVVPNASLEGSTFVNTLIDWRESAEFIEKELVCELIKKLEPKIQEHEKLLGNTKEELNAIIDKHTGERLSAEIKKLEELESKSRIRLSDGVAYATVKYAGDYYNYHSLIADKDYSLTNWVSDDSEDWDLKNVRLRPILLVDNGRMGFGRIARTRITYIRKGVSLTKPFELDDGLSLDVSIRFPDSNFRKRNIIVTLAAPMYGRCDFGVRFNGNSAIITTKRFYKGEDPESFNVFKNRLKTNLFSSRTTIDRLYSRVFKPFRYQKLGIENHNIKEYLTAEHYRLSLVEFVGNPFFLLRKQ